MVRRSKNGETGDYVIYHRQNGVGSSHSPTNSDETISKPIENKKDIQGFELSKFIGMINSQKTIAYEILFSENIIQSNDISSELRKYALEIINSDKLLLEYSYLIEEYVKRLEKNHSLKQYFYILRVMCIMNYIISKNEFPNCKLDTLYSIQENQNIKEVMEVLINKKNEKVSKIEVPDNQIQTVLKYANDVRSSINMEKIKNTKIKQEYCDNLYYRGVLYATDKLNSIKDKKVEEDRYRM